LCWRRGSALLEARLVVELAPIALDAAGLVRVEAPLLIGDLGAARTLPAAHPQAVVAPDTVGVGVKRPIRFLGLNFYKNPPPSRAKSQIRKRPRADRLLVWAGSRSCLCGMYWQGVNTSSICMALQH
jgi:hypothetical protein